MEPPDVCVPEIPINGSFVDWASKMPVKQDIRRSREKRFIKKALSEDTNIVVSVLFRKIFFKKNRKIK